MSSVLKPANEDEALRTVAAALADGVALEIVGNGSKRGWGHAVTASHVLDLSALAGITLYEPEELVLTAGAGTGLSEITEALAANRQMLAFEPADYGPLLGGAADGATIGGVLACNLSGPRRIRAGAARDHFLGFSAVSGRGEAIKAGGRVVKNVTGYDMPKLLAGSFGTLAALTEVTVKVLPAPEMTRTVLVMGLDDEDAVAAMAQALRSPHDISAAAHLPAKIATGSSVSYVAGAGAAVTAVRVEGPPPSVEARYAALRDLLAGFGDIEELHSHNSARLWREVADVTPFAAADGRAVWRISVPPADGAVVVAEIAESCPAAHYFDWGGGLIWMALEADDDAAHETVRGAMGREGGHATLIRGSDSQRAAAPVFEPLSAGAAGLTRRIKEGFDPARILNPGRMYEGV